MQNCTIHDVGQEAIHVKENSSFVTIQGCTIFNTQRIGGCCNGEGVYIGTSSSGPLDNTNNVTIKNNRIHNTTDEGIELKPGTHYCVVEGNELYLNNTKIRYQQGAIEVNQRDHAPQTWTGNPNHVVRGNRIHDNKAGIRLGTGAAAYHNVVYGIAPGYPGIFVDNLNADGFTRSVHYNTVHMTSHGITVSGAKADIQNNIGTTGPNNVAFDAAYFVDAARHDYRLAAGMARLNAGADLGGAVPDAGHERPRDAQPASGADNRGPTDPSSPFRTGGPSRDSFKGSRPTEEKVDGEGDWALFVRGAGNDFPGRQRNDGGHDGGRLFERERTGGRRRGGERRHSPHPGRNVCLDVAGHASWFEGRHAAGRRHRRHDDRGRHLHGNRAGRRNRARLVQTGDWTDDGRQADREVRQWSIRSTSPGPAWIPSGSTMSGSQTSGSEASRWTPRGRS